MAIEGIAIVRDDIEDRTIESSLFDRKSISDRLYSNRGYQCDRPPQVEFATLDEWPHTAGSEQND
jgi:hypothetical protein